MYVVLSCGIFLWLIYGLNIGELPVIAANGVSLILCLTILLLKIIFLVMKKPGSSIRD
jgi:MtN3 and saliva related transmembrane protein